MTTFGGTAFNRMCAGSAIASPLSVANQSRPSRPRKPPCWPLLHSTLRMPLPVVNPTECRILPPPAGAAATSSRLTRKIPWLLVSQR